MLPTINLHNRQIITVRHYKQNWSAAFLFVVEPPAHHLSSDRQPATYILYASCDIDILQTFNYELYFLLIKSIIDAYLVDFYIQKAMQATLTPIAGVPPTSLI